MHSIETGVFDNFTCVFKILVVPHESLACSLACITNMLQALTARYEYTHEFFACTIQAVVNILLVW